MDRFIGHKVKLKFIRLDNLKSNMDRFIEPDEFILLNKIFHLKSNMDRFIVSLTCSLTTIQKI